MDGLLRAFVRWPFAMKVTVCAMAGFVGAAFLEGFYYAFRGKTPPPLRRFVCLLAFGSALGFLLFYGAARYSR